MGVRIPYDKLKKDVKQIFLNLGLTEEQAEVCASVHVQSSADGVESHGVNRIPRFVEYVQKGWVNIKGEPRLVGTKGAVENYDGQLGIGITNALFCSDRAIELAKKHGIGCVALKNTTHWMRGAIYVWKMAEAGFMGMSWINAESCMPLWGSDKRSVGNNPFCMAIPREDGSLVLDMAMSLYAYGKLGVYRLAGKQLPYPRGFDKDGNLTCDSGAIEETIRGLPMGYWKGSGMAQAMLNRRIEAVRNAHSEREGGSVSYPGQRTVAVREESMKKGVHVDEAIWKQLCTLASGDMSTTDIASK